MGEKFRPQPENSEQPAPEAGSGPLGLPPPDPEQQPRPDVWDILVRTVSLEAEDAEGQIGQEEYDRELREVNRLINEIHTKGTARDKLILDLYNRITIQPGGSRTLPFEIEALSPEELQKYRSRVEPLSDEEIVEELRKQEEENSRKAEDFRKKRGSPPPGIIHY